MTCPNHIVTALVAYADQPKSHAQEMQQIRDHFYDDVDVMLSAIETWPEKCHLGLMFYLRLELGLDIWGMDSDDHKTMWYKYRRSQDQEWQVIKPLQCRDYAFEAKYYWQMPYESVFGVPRKPMP